MKYDVHIFAVVRVKVEDVEADSQEEACKKAEQKTDLYRLFESFSPACRCDMEYAEEIQHFLVDEVGDTEYDNSRRYEYSPEGHGELQPVVRK